MQKVIVFMCLVKANKFTRFKRLQIIFLFLYVVNLEGLMMISPCSRSVDTGPDAHHSGCSTMDSLNIRSRKTPPHRLKNTWRKNDVNAGQQNNTPCRQLGKF